MYIFYDFTPMSNVLVLSLSLSVITSGIDNVCLYGPQNITKAKGKEIAKDSLSNSSPSVAHINILVVGVEKYLYPSLTPSLSAHGCSI